MSERPTSRVTSRADLSPSFFLDITTITVDPAYVAAAARKAGLPDPPRRKFAGVLVSGLVALGLLFGVAFSQTRSRAPDARRVRGALVEEVTRRTAIAADLRARQAALRAETAAVRDRQLRTSATGRLIAERLERLEAGAAGVPVSGPGLVIRVADAPDEGDGETQPGEDDGQVRDRDLQDLVNTLWAAGAEAISVNGHRLSSLTAIRAAGEAILVDYAPVSPPYVVEAIGDPDRIEPEFIDSPVSRRFRTWQDVFNLSFRVDRRERLTLRAADVVRLRHAQAVAGGAR